MSNIILSYRREDTKWIVGRIFDRLERHYGANHVFMDINSIPFGLDFREHIQDSLSRCDILVAIIGPRWASPDGRGGNRLDDETDWVRIEIETALAKKIPVIPVLIDGAPLPAARDLPVGMRDLVFRQAAPLDSGRDFHLHVDRLIKVMDQLLAHPKHKSVASFASRSGQSSTGAPTYRIAAEEPAGATTGPHAPSKSSRATTSRGDAPTRRLPIRNQSSSSQLHPSTVSTVSQSENLPSLDIGSLTSAQLFLSLHGRINRAKYWAGVVILAITSIVAGFIIGAVFGSSTLGAMLVTLITAALFYPGYAVAAKRFQDRDKPGQIALFGLVPVLIASLLQAFGLTGAPNNPNALGWICNVVSMGVGLWFLIEFGILKGSQGPNRYGA